MRILIISDSIAPVQEIGAIRWTKIAKYIKKNHPEAEITVLTDQKDYEKNKRIANFKRKDPLLEKELVYFDEYWEIPHSFLLKIYYYLKGNFEKQCDDYNNSIRYSSKISIKKYIGQFLIDIKTKAIVWQMQAAIKKKATDFDVVISTFYPIWTHMVAEYVKKKNRAMIWIADFRDSYANEGEPKLIFSAHQRFTMKHLLCADAIIRVADNISTYTPPSIPIYTISNGFDPQEKLDALAPQKFTLVFTGQLRLDLRDIGIVCRAVKELCEENLLNENDVEISYAGSHGALARIMAEKYHAEKYIRDYGVVPRVQALKMQQHAAILLQLNWNTQKEKCGWSGKVYEYMMAQKPILYVVTGDVPYSDPSKNIHHLGGCCYEQCRHEETYPQMKAYILEKYQEWKAIGNVSVQPDKEYIEQYSYPHIAERVWELIQTQMERRRSSENTTA